MLGDRLVDFIRSCLILAHLIRTMNVSCKNKNKCNLLSKNKTSANPSIDLIELQNSDAKTIIKLHKIIKTKNQFRFGKKVGPMTPYK